MPGTCTSMCPPNHVCLAATTRFKPDPIPAAVENMDGAVRDSRFGFRHLYRRVIVRSADILFLQSLSFRITQLSAAGSCCGGASDRTSFRQRSKPSQNNDGSGSPEMFLTNVFKEDELHAFCTHGYGHLSPKYTNACALHNVGAAVIQRCP